LSLEASGYFLQDIADIQQNKSVPLYKIGPTLQAVALVPGAEKFCGWIPGLTYFQTQPFAHVLWKPLPHPILFPSLHFYLGNGY